MTPLDLLLYGVIVVAGAVVVVILVWANLELKRRDRSDGD